MKSPISEATLRTILNRGVAVIIGFAIGAVLILATGNNPLTAYISLFGGAFGSVYSLTETLVRTIPLLLAGLGAAIAFKCASINLGVEGQIYMGALGATAVALTFNAFPAIVLFPLSLVEVFY